jgi:hypothetical protein
VPWTARPALTSAAPNPEQQNGTPANPPDAAATRAYDRVTGPDVSGAYPQNQRPAARPY